MVFGERGVCADGKGGEEVGGREDKAGDIPPTNGPKNCATAKSFALGTCGVLALANRYGQNQPLAQSCVFLAG